jgi:DNA-binding NarL/FixJ family response regulator
MRPTTLRILVVDDHALMRDALRATIEDAEGLDVAGEAETASDALVLAQTRQPDVVLLDLVLPGAEGLSCLEELRRRHPDTPVVVFSGVDDPDLIAGSLARGAAAFVLKRTNPLDLATAIRQAVEPTMFHRPAPLSGASRARLTEKELEVLAQLALGRSNREIAQALWISVQTVKFHLGNVYRKLGAATRTEAVRIAHQRALVPSPV